MIYQADSLLKEKLYPMFEDFNSTVVLSCLQGHMGRAWVDDLYQPKVAQLTVGIFVYFAGDCHAKEAEEMLNNLPEFPLVIVNTDEWKKKIEDVHKGAFEKFSRYEFYKQSQDLDREHLESLSSGLPVGYELKRMNQSIASNPQLHEMSEDFISQFDSVDDFLKRGIGIVIQHKGQIVCGATSFSIYDDGIEIEIATHPDYRRKGLATIAASAIMLDCLNQGLYPSWDAANLESVKLAEKLGYIFNQSYDTYFIDN